MAENIKQVEDGLDANHTGQVSETDGGTPAPAGALWGSIGAMPEDAELLDAVVEDAMRKRRLQAWCPSPEDFAALESMAEETGRSLSELLDEALRLLLERRPQRQAGRGKGAGRGDV
jgi:Ribbon-helix-helix protein, copG family